MGLLDGKVAIVTGAGRGIGRGHALLLAAQGARVVVNDLGTGMAGDGRDTTAAQAVVDEIVAAGGEAVASTDDVATWDGAQRLVAAAIDTFGTLDVLVNNAGVLRDAMSFNMTEAEWDTVIDVHLKGHFAPCHHAVRYWRERGKAGEPVSGRIINTASESGLYGQAGQANYAAAKAGNRRDDDRDRTRDEEVRRDRERHLPACAHAHDRLGARCGRLHERARVGPEQIAPVVGFLASDAAADVSGQVFVVWGTRVHLMQGWTMVATLDRGEGRWTPEELVARKDELFAVRSSKIPPMGFGL
ncbi:MAG: short-chain type dehydrogenase/reductase [Acidimicrobiia bacterium]|nr:MAG: short-chain type dehydrogenase/reductase [Acidimicrobiia bacterium]